jgi:hypothetical protein
MEWLIDKINSIPFTKMEIEVDYAGVQSKRMLTYTCNDNKQAPVLSLH